MENIYNKILLKTLHENYLNNLCLVGIFLQYLYSNKFNKTEYGFLTLLTNLKESIPKTFSSEDIFNNFTYLSDYFFSIISKKDLDDSIKLEFPVKHLEFFYFYKAILLHGYLYNRLDGEKKIFELHFFQSESIQYDKSFLLKKFLKFFFDPKKDLNQEEEQFFSVIYNQINFFKNDVIDNKICSYYQFLLSNSIEFFQEIIDFIISPFMCLVFSLKNKNLIWEKVITTVLYKFFSELEINFSKKIKYLEQKKLNNKLISDLTKQIEALYVTRPRSKAETSANLFEFVFNKIKIKKNLYCQLILPDLSDYEHQSLFEFINELILNNNLLENKSIIEFLLRLFDIIIHIIDQKNLQNILLRFKSIENPLNNITDLTNRIDSIILDLNTEKKPPKFIERRAALSITEPLTKPKKFCLSFCCNNILSKICCSGFLKICCCYNT